MPIKNAFVMPHGSDILDPENNKAYPGCQTLHDACLKLAENIYNINPDLIFLITPHGNALKRSHCLYFNSVCEGNVDSTAEYSKFTAHLEIHTEYTKALFDQYQLRLNLITDGLVSYASEEIQPLRWAEVIPVWFLNSGLNLREKKPKFLVFSVAEKRHEKDDRMIDEMEEIGIITYKFLNSLPENVLVLISADLAHTHKIPGGPKAGTEPYGVSPTSGPFDEAIEKWAKNAGTDLGDEYLLLEARKILRQALSCGYLGLVVLNKFLHIYLEEKSGRQVKRTVLARLAPLYYGMMVSSLEFN